MATPLAICAQAPANSRLAHSGPMVSPCMMQITFERFLAFSLDRRALRAAGRGTFRAESLIHWAVSR